MKKLGWLVTGALLAGGVVYMRGGCLNGSMKAPDQRLASRFEDLCKIARDGAKDPVRGVRKLGVYMVKHGGDITGDFVDTIGVIERIRDDEKHDDRARLARDRWDAVACPNAWMDFGEAIDGSPEAQQMIQDAVDRLGRTFEIIASGNGLPKLLNFEFPAGRLAAEARRARRAQVTKP